MDSMHLDINLVAPGWRTLIEAEQAKSYWSGNHSRLTCAPLMTGLHRRSKTCPEGRVLPSGRPGTRTLNTSRDPLPVFKTGPSSSRIPTMLLTVTAGFEPARDVTTPARFPGESIQPLSHVTICCLAKEPVGFEPTEDITALTAFRGQCDQPLCHSSICQGGRRGDRTLAGASPCTA
jgi:hypothetical protein